MRPTPDEAMMLQVVAKANPRLVEFVQKWVRAELDILPSQQQDVAKKQGYCLALQELYKLLVPPAPAARQGPPGGNQV
jgi:hypothetical protein